MNKQVNFRYSVILEYFLKNKALKEVVSEIDNIITFSTEDITRHYKYQTRYLEKFLMEKF